MPNLSQNADVICPYFQRISAGGKGIICEGLVPGSETTSIFSCRSNMERWVDTVCARCHYTRCCLVAATLEDFYTED